MKTMDDFKVFYDKDLINTLKSLEGKRKKAVNAFWMIILGAIIATGGTAFSFGLKMPTALGFSFLIGGIAIVVMFMIKLFKLKSDVKWKFKEEVIKKMIHFIDPSLNYNPASCIRRQEFSESKIFIQGIDRYKGDDLVQGTIGKTAVRFSELHAEYESRDSDGKKTHHTIFKGIFFIADFNKHFKGETIVLPDTAEKLFGRLGTWFQKMNIARPDLVKLENPEFEKEFAVYGNDQVEARYILTPVLMERIMEFKKKSGKVGLSFRNSQVNIALTVRQNLFEAPFFKSMLDYELVANYFSYLLLCTGIVEDLDLNTRIWAKE